MLIVTPVAGITSSVRAKYPVKLPTLGVTFRSYGAKTSCGNVCSINISSLRDWVDSSNDLDHCRHDLTDAALQLAIVGDGRAHRYLSGGDRWDAERDQLCGVYK